MEPLHSFEFFFIKLLQQISTPQIDQFFKFLDFFDRQEFIFILVSAIWIGLSWKEGIKLFYVILLSAFINLTLKDFFQQPRPFHIEENLAIIKVSGYGFPSGAAQTTVLLSGILLSFWKNTWTWIISATYIFLVSLSRVYLGVHFPSDLLGGWLIGGLLLLIYLWIFPVTEKFLNSKPILVCLFLSGQISLAILSFDFSLPFIKLAAVSLGVGIGIHISRSQKLFLEFPKNWLESICRMIFGIFGTFFIYIIAKKLPIQNKAVLLWVQFFSIGLWLSLVANVLWSKMTRYFSKNKVEFQ